MSGWAGSGSQAPDRLTVGSTDSRGLVRKKKQSLSMSSFIYYTYIEPNNGSMEEKIKMNVRGEK